MELNRPGGKVLVIAVDVSGHALDQCYYKSGVCRKCYKQGHIAKMCKGKPTQQELQPSHGQVEHVETEDDGRLHYPSVLHYAGAYHKWCAFADGIGHWYLSFNCVPREVEEVFIPHSSEKD